MEAEKNAYGFVELTPDQAKAAIEAHPAWQVVDVRTPEEYALGWIDHAINVPLETLEEKAEADLPDLQKPLLVYCHSGRRSKIASAMLAKMGYTHVYEFGGILQWPYGLNHTHTSQN